MAAPIIRPFLIFAEYMPSLIGMISEARRHAFQLVYFDGIVTRAPRRNNALICTLKKEKAAMHIAACADRGALHYFLYLYFHIDFIDRLDSFDTRGASLEFAYLHI